MKAIKRCFILLPLLVFSLLQCEKSDKQQQVSTDPIDNDPVQVEIPESDWDRTLVILPVKSRADEEAAVSRMITEQITSLLSLSPRLRIVRAPSAAWIEEERIETDYILTGEVLESEEPFRMRFTLMDTEQDSMLWSEDVEEEFETVLIFSEEASAEVQAQMGTSLTGRASRKPASAEIGKKYLEAAELLSSELKAETDRAIQLFKEILREDSTFTKALIGLSESYLRIYEKGWDQNIVWIRLAQEACLKAMNIDSDPVAQTMLGRIYLIRGDLKHAEDAFRRALEVNTNDADAWKGLARVFISYGLYEPGLEVYNIVSGLNPADPETAMSRALLLIGLSRYGEARETMERIIDLHPTMHHLHSILALSLYYEGKDREAEEALQKGLTADALQPFSHGVLAMIYARRKGFDEALGEIELEVKPYAGNDASLATAVAAVYALIGQKGTALEWLEKAVGWGYAEYPWLKSDPNFEGLKEDVRYQQLMERLKQRWQERKDNYSLR